MQIHLISAESGATLIEGTARGKSLLGTSTERAAKQVLEILVKAFAQ